MTKTEQYFKAIQKLAVNNQRDIENYLKEIEKFRISQQILKRGKIKTKSEFIVIYFIEYINTHFKQDFLNRKNNQDIYTFLTYIISKMVLPLKDVCVDEVVRKVILNKVEVINNIIVDNYPIKKDKILAMKKEIKKLQQGMI